MDIIAGVANVIVAVTLDEAVKFHDHLDVIVCDLQLPDSSGADTIRALVERFPDVPVIVLANEPNVSECLEAGADDVIIKQFDLGNVAWIKLGIAKALFRRSIKKKTSSPRLRDKMQRAIQELASDLQRKVLHYDT